MERKGIERGSNNPRPRSRRNQGIVLQKGRTQSLLLSAHHLISFYKLPEDLIVRLLRVFICEPFLICRSAFDDITQSPINEPIISTFPIRRQLGELCCLLFINRFCL